MKQHSVEGEGDNLFLPAYKSRHLRKMREMRLSQLVFVQDCSPEADPDLHLTVGGGGGGGKGGA